MCRCSTISGKQNDDTIVCESRAMVDAELEPLRAAKLTAHFGRAREFSSAQRDWLFALLRPTVVRDVPGMAAAMETMGYRTRSVSREGLEGYARESIGQMAWVNGKCGGFWNQLEMVSRIAEFGRVVRTLLGLFEHDRPDVSATARMPPILLMALTGAARPS
jgi:hypothetical protein